MPETDRIARLGDALTAAFPELAPAEQRLAVGLLRLLARGEHVADADLADVLGLEAADVRATLKSWPGGYRDEQERVVGFMGLTVIELGEHRVHLDGRPLSAWCAWDTLFLPELLAREAHVTSRCPTTRGRVSLRVAAAGPTELEPAAAVISLLEPDRPFAADVMRSFCHYVHFFSSEAAGAEWTSQHEGTFTLPVDHAYEIGQITNRSVFAAALDDPAGLPSAARD